MFARTDFTVCFVGLILTFATGRAPAAPVEIDFDGLAPGTVVTDQYPEATFSADDPQENVVYDDYDFGPLSVPNYITTAEHGVQNAINATYVDFTVPVRDLRFFLVGDDAPGLKAKIDIFESGVWTDTFMVFADGVFDVPDLVDLTAYDMVTRIEIYDLSDPGGLGWDLFRFDTIEDLALSVDGVCPGDVMVTASGAGRGSEVALIMGRAEGSFTIPDGMPCGGTVLGLGGAGLTVVGTATADADGIAIFGGTVPTFLCGRFLQAIDLSSCTTSNVEPLGG